MPSSQTSIQTSASVEPAVMAMCPPSGVYLTALPMTFIITCSSRLRSPTIKGRLSGGV